MNWRVRDDLIVGAILVAAVVAILTFFVGMGMLVENWKCQRRWADSGSHSRWQAGSGCQVQRKDGTWVPERLLRDLMQGTANG